MKPFRLAHISDTHLGYRATNKPAPETGRNQRTVDVELAFTRLIDDLIARDVDGVIHSGDVFHHSRPTWQALRHFIREMRRLERAGIPTLVIAGNHDTPRVRTGGSVFTVLELALPETRFIAEFEAAPHVDLFGHDVFVDAIPHGALTNPDPVTTSHVPGKRNVLVTHGLVPDIIPGPGTFEPGEQLLDAMLLRPEFDYIALGHIHQDQQVSSNAWYAGASERFGWNDIESTPGYNLVELGSPGTPASVERIELPARPMIALKPIYGDSRDPRDLVDIVLRRLDELDEPEAMVRVELRNTMRPVRREVASILRREVGDRVWFVDVAPDRSVFSPGLEPESDDTAPLDLHALFTEFVAMRTPQYADARFAPMLLERGSRSLTDALLAEETPVPEDA